MHAYTLLSILFVYLFLFCNDRNGYNRDAAKNKNEKIYHSINNITV